MPAYGGGRKSFRFQLDQQFEEVEHDEQLGPRCNKPATETDW